MNNYAAGACMASASHKKSQSFSAARAEFDDIETHLGEIAAYLSEIADGLGSDPETLRLRAHEWPDLPSLLKLKATWIERRNALITAWRELDPANRAAHPLPPIGAEDPSRPVV